MPLRVAIVGCGQAAENHAIEIKKLNCARLVSVCDSEPLMAEQLSVRHGIDHWYSDTAQMLREQDLDVVHIATPPATHLEVAQQAVEAGCHVFVEKPVAEDAQQAAKLIRLAQANSCKLTIGWTYFLHPTVRAARQRLARGVVGELVHLDVLVAYDLHSSFGAAVLQDRSHWVHHLPAKLFHNNLDHPLALVGEFIDLQHCAFEVQAWRAADSPYPDLLDEIRVMIVGATTSAHIAFSCRARPVGHSITMVGDKNSIRVDIANQLLTQSSVSRLPGPLGRLAGGLDQTWQMTRQTFQNLLHFVRSDFPPLPGLGFLVAEFYKCIESGSDVPISYEQILSVSLFIDRIVEHLRGLPVMLE